MTIMANADFAKLVEEMAEPQESFEPTAVYDPDGDCIEFLFKPDCFYAERVDDLVTVYHSQETDEIVGSLIKGVVKYCRKVTKKYPGFAISISAGHIRLEHLFLARLWETEREPGPLVLAYEKLIEVAEETRIQAELVCV